MVGISCDSLLIKQNHVLPATAMWKSIQGHEMSDQGVTVKVSALWNVHKFISMRCGNRCGLCGFQGYVYTKPSVSHRIQIGTGGDKVCVRCFLAKTSFSLIVSNWESFEDSAERCVMASEQCLWSCFILLSQYC